jgi:hypothetical protein
MHRYVKPERRIVLPYFISEKAPEQEHDEYQQRH